MILNVYSIFDSRSSIYAHPFYFALDTLAHRACIQLLGSNPLITSHPQDFTLYKIGTFDDTSGVITGMPPVAIFSFNQLKIEENV